MYRTQLCTLYTGMKKLKCNRNLNRVLITLNDCPIMSEAGVKRRRSFLLPKPFSDAEDQSQIQTAEEHCEDEVDHQRAVKAKRHLAKFRSAALTASLIAKLSREEKKRQVAREAAVKRLKREQRERRRQEKEKRNQMWDTLRRVRDAQIREERITKQRQRENQKAKDKLRLPIERARPLSNMAKSADSALSIKKLYKMPGYNKIQRKRAGRVSSRNGESLLEIEQSNRFPKTETKTMSSQSMSRMNSFMSLSEFNKLRSFERKGARISDVKKIRPASAKLNREYCAKWDERQNGHNFSFSRVRRQRERLKNIKLGYTKSHVRNTQTENFIKKAEFDLQVLQKGLDEDEDKEESVSESFTSSNLLSVKERLKQQRQALKYVEQEAQQACSLQDMGVNIHTRPFTLPKDLDWSTTLKSAAIEFRTNMIGLNQRLGEHRKITQRLLREPHSYY